MGVADQNLSPGLFPSVGPAQLDRLVRFSKAWVEDGATWVDLPWVAPMPLVRETCPPGRRIFETPHGCLLASGEQAFIWLDGLGQLPTGLLVGWSPCYRDEDPIEQWHRFAFAKVEAYRMLGQEEHSHSALMEMVDMAARHMEKISPGVHVRQRWFKDGTADLEINGHEVGSYGVRPHPSREGRRYLYGTVVAEPRFTMALAG